MQQTTIKQKIEHTGIGLHSGKQVKLVLRPAAEDTGIVFHVSGPNGQCEIIPFPKAVVATGLATTLGKDDTAVSTVEHLLAALRGLSIDNVHVDADGGEIPIMDGSAAPFARLLSEAGIRTQSKPRKVLRIKKSISFSQDDKLIRAEPYHGFYVDYSIDFPHPVIGKQRLALDVTPRSFSQVAKARTFGFLRDVEMLQERGLALGGSLDNAVVLDEQGVLNKEGLRHDDEFVRHKLLDFIGDMAMLPLPLQGRFTVSCSGHTLNNEFLRHIVDAGSHYLEEVCLGGKPVAAPLPRPQALEVDLLPAHAYAG
jgi:UDP-3-O-[3-hydroxymyristoyl] N-acetylglucosamine deacetylase